MIGIVLDIGTANSKIGYAGQSQPRISTQSIYLQLDSNNLQHLEQHEIFMETYRNQRLFGYNIDIWRKDINGHQIFNKIYSDQQNRIGLLNYQINKEYFERFVDNLLREVKEKEGQAQYALMMIQSVYLRKDQLMRFRKEVCQHFFESLQIGGIYFMKSSVATAYSEGRSNAIVVDSGQNFTTITRIIDGYNQKTINLNFGGNLINLQLQTILKHKNYLKNTIFLQNQQSNNIFGHFCKQKELLKLKDYFKVDNNSQIQSNNIVKLQLPDKNVVEIERSQIHQPFTKYSQYNHPSKYIFNHKYTRLTNHIFQLLEDNIDQYVFNAIDTTILTGGNMLFSDLTSRIQQNFNRTIINKKYQNKYITVSNNMLKSAWIGGSIAGNMNKFESYWISNKDYKDNGLVIVNKKCPY